MEDSGKRKEFTTGAVRDSAEDKPRPDLISPYAQWRKGEWLRLGAIKYDERNWEKGMQFSRCVASMFRHLLQYMMGKTNEDHLAAIAVNAEFLMHYEKMIEMYRLPATLNDMPRYEDKPKPYGTELNYRAMGFCSECVRKIIDSKEGEFIVWCTECNLLGKENNA